MSGFEVRKLISDAMLDDGAAFVRYPSGEIAAFKITPIVTFPAMGDFEAWEARRRHIELMNQVLMGSITSR